VTVALAPDIVVAVKTATGAVPISARLGVQTYTAMVYPLVP
jgi:hypothetical protein